MNKLEKKKIKKIYKRIDNLATGGYSNVYDFYKYFNELIDRGDYRSLETTLSLKYNIDITLFETTDDARKYSWKEIMFQTKTSYEKKIKKLLEDKEVYQVGTEIYDINEPTSSTQSTTPLGEVKELDAFYDKDHNEWVLNFPPYINRTFAKLSGLMTTYIEVKKTSATYSIIIDDFNYDREELNLLDRYKTAIDYLKGDYII